MSKTVRTIYLIAALTPLLAFPADKVPGARAGSADSKWDFAGEIQGIAFQLRITGACKDGSKVAVRFRGSYDEDLIVTFRLNDADWRKTFTQPLKAGGKPVTVTFTPEDGQVCHPYVDQVEVADATPVAEPSQEAEPAADASGAEAP